MSYKTLTLLCLIGLLSGCGVVKESNGMHNPVDISTRSTVSKIVQDKDTPPVTPTQVVQLEDGDVYEMEVTKVVKEIGNQHIAMLAYNGSIPGPVIKVQKGATVTLNFTNKVQEIETLLHSHGLRLDNKMDGVAKSMGGQQNPIKYGEKFSYTLTFPDEGVFWYHPHVQEELQQELGMYGNYIVSPIDPSYRSPVNREEYLMLDDILINKSSVPEYLSQGTNYALMGRFGNIMLINGDPDYRLSLKKGEVVRLYLTNVSNTRTYNFSIPGLKIKRIGGDIGRYEKESFEDSILIAPAERYIIEVLASSSGTFLITNSNPEKTTTLGSIVVTEEPVDYSYEKEFFTIRTNSDMMKEFEDLRSLIDAPIQKELMMTVAMMNMGNGHHQGMGMMAQSISIEREDPMPTMNEQSTSQDVEWVLIDRQTQKQNMDINRSFNKGDKVKVRVFNDPNSAHPMQHPIHFHGQRFVVLSRNGVENDNFVWKDTVLVPAGEYVDIILDASNPGVWMGHCHISEHLGAGMMMKFYVE